MFGGIERLAGTEQFARKIIAQHGLAGGRASVQHQHRLARRRPDRHVVQLQFGQDLAGLKAEVLHDPGAVLRLRIFGGLRAGSAQQHAQTKREMTAESLKGHLHPPDSYAQSGVSVCWRHRIDRL